MRIDRVILTNTTSGVALAAASLLAASPVAAQTASAPSATEESSNEIVVTARKREESLQDVPVAVSAFGTANLERQQIVNTADLSLAVPSVLVTQTGGSANAAQIFIRGFGQDALGFNSESPVGIYFDDVYLGRVQGGLLDVLDIERVEFLRGPQGTLYGRNSTTGAVKFVPRAPDLAQAHYTGEVATGSFNRIDVRGSVSVPVIADRLALKLDISSRNVDGYIRGVDSTGADNGLTSGGVSRAVARLSLRWAMSDTTTLDLSGDIARDRSGVLNSTKLNCPAGPNGAGCVPLYGSPYKTGINFPGVQFQDSWGASAKLTHEFGGATFKSITAYRGFKGKDPIDLLTLPGIPVPIIYGQDQKQFSQELQLISSGTGKLNYALGLFYFNETWTTDTNFVGARRNVDHQSANSYAAYGEVYYGFTDSLTLTLGGRVTHDEKRITRDIYAPLTATAPSTSVTPAKYSQTVFTPKVALQWKPNDDVLAYASYSQGYRPGGYSESWPGNAIAANSVLQAEKVTSYELGLKTSWLDKRLTLNFALYQSDYDNLQQAILTTTSFFTASSNVRVRGLEFEGAFRITPHFSLYGNVGLLDDKIKSSNIPGDNLSRRLRYAPEVSYKFGGEYAVPVTRSGLELFGSASVAGVGRTPMDQDNTLVLFMPAYALVDAQIGFRAPDGKYRVAFGVKNLTDKVYWRSGIPNAGLEGRFYAPPRTWSLTFGTRF